MRLVSRFLLLGLALAIVSIILLFLLAYTKGREAVKDTVVIAPVARVDVTQRVRAVGRTRPRSSATVRSIVPGSVRAILVKEGDVVSVGATLCEITPDPSFARDLQRARSAIQSGEASLRLAGADFGRKRQLWSEGLVAASDLESSEARFQQAQVALELARSDVQLLMEVAGSAGAQRSTAGRPLIVRVVSPVNGTVVSVKAAVGDTITSGTSAVGEGGGTALLRIADLDRVLVRAEIAEHDVRWVAANQEVSVSIPALSANRYRGLVETIAREASGAQGAGSYYANVALLSPGVGVADLSCDLDILIAKKEGVLAVPRSALIQRRASWFVRLRSKASKSARDVEVARGLVGDDLVEILRGVAEGDQVEVAPVR